MEIPTPEQTIKNAEDYGYKLIDHNVNKVLKAMNRNLRGSLRLEYLDSSIRSPENVVDCVLMKLREVAGPEGWFFDKEYRGIGWYSIHWSSSPVKLKEKDSIYPILVGICAAALAVLIISEVIKVYGIH